MGFLAKPVYYSAAYAGLVGATVVHHEPWADEAQSWLLARDAGIGDLWTKLLHYEGTPGLWHTLLYVLIRVGVPYDGLNIFSAILGLAAVWLLLRHAPLPLAIRLALPFTYFLSYQYSVVARSYDLIPVLLFGCAILYNKAAGRLGVLTGILVLMAAVSVHGFVLSLSIAIAFYVAVASKCNGKSLFVAGVTYVTSLVLLAASAWPAPDVTFVTRRNLSPLHFFEVSSAIFSNAFTGQGVTSVVVVALSIPFLWRGRGLLVFVVSACLLCAVGATVYVQVWHDGVLFLAWLFSIWIAAGNTRPTATLLAALVIVIAFQSLWTIRSISYDWTHAYSGSLQAARFLHQRHIPSEGLLAVGFSCTAIQPYFSTNVFSNWNGSRGGPSFWSWSTRNRVDDPTALLSSRRPPYLMIGYKAASERMRWASLAPLGGYRVVQHFSGDLFWRDHILEPEAFDLYKRSLEDVGPSVSSSVSMADQTTEIQLLSGLYGLENDGWRWTSRQFSVALKPPPQADRLGATLVLHLYIPDIQIQRLGPMTIRADLDGYPLTPQTFRKGGAYTYSRQIEARLLGPPVVPVTFTFDKAVPPSDRDLRELAGVVTSVALDPK